MKEQTPEVLLPVRGFARLPSGKHLSNISPPVSPCISSPRLRYGRTRSGRAQPGQLIGPALQLQLHHHQHPQHQAPRSVYRSPEVFHLLWPQMQNSTSIFEFTKAWRSVKEGGLWKPCLKNLVSLKGLQDSKGFIIIEANGGLNQQRSSICNAVAVAGILNATLVVPSFHFNSIWQDPSVFREIFDEDFFIESLAESVRVVKRLPDYLSDSVGHNMSLIPNIKVKAGAPASFYIETVLPKLLETGVVRIAPFANRLSFDKISREFQKLRCFTNFEALKFAQPIAVLGKRLVEMMKVLSAKNDGNYVAVHLRFEEDMVAFSCCTYNGGEDEKYELNVARERGWRGKFNRPGRLINPAAIRMDGKCPLTPLEVGMILRGIGFHNDTPIYLAAGKIYKEEESMAPLRQMFPCLQTKETLLSSEELEPFKKFSSRLAALDYTVCLHSEVFVTTQGGNFPHFLIGHRRYLNNGHSKTLKPDKRKLAVLLDSPDISWELFSENMHSMWRHSDSKGHELRKPSSSIYTYPAPDCMCSDDEQSFETSPHKWMNWSSGY